MANGEREANAETEIFGMTGGSPNYEEESEDSYTLTQSQATSAAKSYFDPPIENYRKIYKYKGTGKFARSHLSSGGSNEGQ